MKTHEKQNITEPNGLRMIQIKFLGTFLLVIHSYFDSMQNEVPEVNQMCYGCLTLHRVTAMCSESPGLWCCS